MAKFRYRKVSKYLTPFVKKVFDRDCIDYTEFRELNSTHNEVGVVLTSSRFEEVIEDALAMAEGEELGCLVVSRKTAKSMEKMRAINPNFEPYLVRA